MSKQLLTHSRMQAFKLCRKKHYWAYELGLRRVVDAKALRMGSAGHEGLDAYKKTGSLEAAIHAVSDMYAGLPEGIEQYDWEIERETVECLVAGYVWRWQDFKFEVLQSEQAFNIPLRNPSTNRSSTIWQLAGKIDGIIKIDNRNLILEHKFISDDISPDSDYWRRLQIDTQITIYTHAARELGYEPESVLYDVIRKPTIKPSAVPVLDDNGDKVVLGEDGKRVMTAQGKPRQSGDKAKGYVLQTRSMFVEEWSQKLQCDIELRPDWYYQRQEIARLDDDIAEMKVENWEIQKAIREAQKTNAHFKTVNLGSCSYCSYFGLCSSKFKFEDRIPEGFVHLGDVNPELS